MSADPNGVVRANQMCLSLNCSRIGLVSWRTLLCPDGVAFSCVPSRPSSYPGRGSAIFAWSSIFLRPR